MQHRIVMSLVMVSTLAATAAAQEWAQARLENSPRHLEWVEIQHDDRTVEAFLAYPEIREKASAVVVIHEIFGLTDWVRGVTDQLAEAGYIAIAPDLLSGMAPEGGGTSELGSGDAVRKVIQTLPPKQITADLNAAVEYAKNLPACNGQVVVAGFCWGGTQTFRYATNNPNIEAAFVFYGSGPEELADIERIEAPIYGFYGENDARINATIAQSKELMQKAGKNYEPVIYDNAGHGFLRAGEQPDAEPANAQARKEAWERWTKLIEEL